MRLWLIWICCCVVGLSAAQYVAVLETVADKEAQMSGAEARYLTDELRKQALTALPGYTIMTRENIQALLPPNKSLEEICAGAQCLVSLGKEIAADFVAQGRVSRVGGRLALAVELYETRAAKLVGSFTERRGDVDGLIDAAQTLAGPLFSRAREGAVVAPGVRSGFSGLEAGPDFELDVPQTYLVEITTEPAGALVSMDGRPLASCRATPCKVEVTGGTHRFLAVQESYEDAEVSAEVKANGQKISLTLLPNYGWLVLAPRMHGVARAELEIQLDGRSVKPGEFKLSPGNHTVRMEHPCLENTAFQVGIVQGGREVFEQELVPRLGGLALSALKGEEPQSVPVWIDGQRMGETPWSGKVPLCAKVEIGEDRARVDVRLKYRETVKYAHALPVRPVGMAAIPAGCFRMGSKENSDEQPMHRVCLDAFRLDRTEVTQGDYQKTMRVNPSEDFECGPECPVEQVNWFQAMEYCIKQGKRLPTEAEWEYAALAGATTRWACGLDESCLDAVAWFKGNGEGKIHPVGAKQPNAWGLYDMAGNVWEWTADWYADDYYAQALKQNPPGPSRGEQRVYRGGSWEMEAASLRPAYRYFVAPENRYAYLGFRCAVTGNAK